jgi:hypothetical protein
LVDLRLDFEFDFELDVGLDFALELPPLLIPLPELPPLLIPLPELPPLLIPLPELPPLLIPLPELPPLLIPLPELPPLLIPLPILFPVDFGEVAVVGEPVGDCVGLVVPAAVNPLVTLVAVIVPDGSSTDGNVLDSAAAISSTCCEDTAWVNTTVTTIDPLDTTHHSTELLFNPLDTSANSVVILHTMSSSFCERVV